MWIGVTLVVYVFSLPYAIVIFDWSRKLLSLPILKIVPLALILGLSAIYFLTSKARRSENHLVMFVLPSVLVLIAVLLLESNPIKHFHIPEYFFLCYLVHQGLRQNQNSLLLIAMATLLSCVLGVVDEVHQGIHPARYFGWKDMLINAAGSLIGGLFLATQTHWVQCDWSAVFNNLEKHKAQTLLLLMFALCAVYSISKLLIAAQYASIHPWYPFSLFMINLSMSGAGFYLALRMAYRVATDQTYALLIYWPIIALTVLHAVIVLAYVLGESFQ